MGILEDLADALARDAIAVSEELEDEMLLTEVAKRLGASSTTMEEAYLTSIRIRLAERRARKWLEATHAARKAKAEGG